MFIARCQIKNYKSFKESEVIQFKQGFNVVVGQNNAGKTALVEALSVQYSNNPHRSLVTQPEGDSSVKMTFGIEPHEGFDFIRNANQVYLPEHSNVPARQTIDRFQSRQM